VRTTRTSATCILFSYKPMLWREEQLNRGLPSSKWAGSLATRTIARPVPRSSVRAVPRDLQIIFLTPDLLVIV